MNRTNRDILRIAVPAIVSNVTVPLLGLVDAGISGHLGATAYIGAVAAGGMMFNLMYWLLGFLRMGTSGLTSQALGAGRRDEVEQLLSRSLLTGLLLGVGLLVLCWPLREAGLWLLSPTDEVANYARAYFNICIWGAPAMLPLMALNGWFLGMQDSRRPMLISIVQNVVNIVASFAFVFGLDMKVEGVALGTLVAQWTGLGMGLWLVKKVTAPLRTPPAGGEAITVVDEVNVSDSQPSPPIGGSRRGAVYIDIFLRTFFMVAVMFFFTSAGARQGDTVLAVNSLLLQFSLLFSYVMDGFAYAAEAMCGKFYGAGDRQAFRRTVQAVFVWGGGLVVVFTSVYALGGLDFLRLLTDDAAVVTASNVYLPWATLLPLCGVAAFVWDGVYIGTTRTRQMLVSSAIAAVLFFGCYVVLTRLFTEKANHMLWLAYLLFLLTRGVVQTIYYGRLFSPEQFRRARSRAQG